MRKHLTAPTLDVNRYVETLRLVVKRQKVLDQGHVEGVENRQSLLVRHPTEGDNGAITGRIVVQIGNVSVPLKPPKILRWYQEVIWLAST